jgi:mRNA interferase YafQ
MTYELVYTNSFKKDLKLAQKRNYDMNKMKDVLTLLKSGKKLAVKYKDHELKGDWKGFRELHISPDWFLFRFYNV